MAASRCLSGRPVMKINATPLALGASDSFRAGSIGLWLDLSTHGLTPQAPAGSTSQAPSATKPKLSASRSGQLVSDVSSRSSTSAGRFARVAFCLLDELLRRIEHRRDVNIVIFLVILEQQILDRADIERRRECGFVSVGLAVPPVGKRTAFHSLLKVTVVSQK